MCYYNGVPPLPIADSICSLTRVTRLGTQPAQIERCTMEGQLANFKTNVSLLECLARPLPSHCTTKVILSAVSSIQMTTALLRPLSCLPQTGFIRNLCNLYTRQRNQILKRPEYKKLHSIYQRFSYTRDDSIVDKYSNRPE